MTAWIASLLVDPKVRVVRSPLHAPLAAIVLVCAASIVLNVRHIEALQVSQGVLKQFTFLLSFVLVFLLVVSVVSIHYEALLRASRLAERMTIPPRRRIVVVIAAAFLAHLVEIALFAAGYALMDLHPGLGEIGGVLEGGPLDYLYFSISMYTTLGVGDLVATGLMRLPAGVESLTGLVLVTWTASFSYLAMERFWRDH